MKRSLQKSSKKQQLYDKYLKNKTTENKNIYTEYNALFKVLQKKSKKLTMQNALVNEHDIKKNMGYNKTSKWQNKIYQQ